LRFCYEARSCGYGIRLQLSASGHDCVVVAPSLIPKEPGDWIKTDRRGRIQSAKLRLAGASTAGAGTPHAVRASRRAASSSRAPVAPGLHYRRPAWTKPHRRWLAGLKFQHTVHHIVLEDYIEAVDAADRLTAQIEAMLPIGHWPR
jgi:transposase